MFGNFSWSSCCLWRPIDFWVTVCIEPMKKPDKWIQKTSMRLWQREINMDAPDIHIAFCLFLLAAEAKVSVFRDNQCSEMLWRVICIYAFNHGSKSIQFSGSWGPPWFPHTYLLFPDSQLHSKLILCLIWHMTKYAKLPLRVKDLCYEMFSQESFFQIRCTLATSELSSYSLLSYPLCPPVYLSLYGHRLNWIELNWITNILGN